MRGLGPSGLAEGCHVMTGAWLPPKFVGNADLGGRLAQRGSDG